MSGIVGHTMYAILGAKAAAARGLPVAALLRRHRASYLAGAYLGCDIQTMPEAVRTDTRQELGYGTVPLDQREAGGGPVEPFALPLGGKSYTPREIHGRFYGRSHLTFGWSRQEQGLVVPVDHLPDYCTAVLADTVEFFGPGHRPVAYVLGWMTHLVGDGLIKSIWPGVTMHLLDGKYTAKNRPIQDLVTYHEIGCRELQLDWPALFADVAETPVEAVQLHYMRVAPPRGRLARENPEGWLPADQDLLSAVLRENRRYLRIYKDRVLADMALEPTSQGFECNAALREATGGLSYDQMVVAAEKAGLRRALVQIAEAIADLFSEATFFVPKLNEMPQDEGPGWNELRSNWKIP